MGVAIRFVFISFTIICSYLKSANFAEIQRQPWYSSGWIYPGSLNPWPFSHPLPPAPGSDPGNLHYWSRNVDVPPVQPATIYGGYLPDLWEDSRGFADPTQFNPMAALLQNGGLGKRRRRRFLPSADLPPLPPSHSLNNQLPDRSVGPTNYFEQSFQSPYDPPIQSNSNWREKSWPSVRQQPMDGLNQGMQREVWNSWMPDGNYGMHVGSRPDFGRGGFVAARSLFGVKQPTPIG